MQTSSFNTPALFGDHHVTEVRRILMSLPGVQQVYASSAFRVVEVTFDPKEVEQAQIAGKLAEAGYLEEIPLLSETGMAVEKKEGEGSFRHTATYETTNRTISFAQRVNYLGRPLWNCPGLGTIKLPED